MKPQFLPRLMHSLALRRALACSVAVVPGVVWLNRAAPAPSNAASQPQKTAIPRSGNALPRAGIALPNAGIGLPPFGKALPKAGIAVPASRIVRIGLSTKGGAINVWAGAPLTISDAAQVGRTLKVAAGQAIALAFGADEKTSAHARFFHGPIRIRAQGVVSGAWQMPTIRPSWGTICLSSDGSSARYGRPYRGSLEVAPQIYSFEPATHLGPLRMVNVVNLEDYLKGVVPWEMNPSAPLEALKAQAICARSETLAKIAAGRHKLDGFDLCDYDHCQGYPGVENEKPASTLAVEQTAGLAIFCKGRVADAVYGTNSGGITASSGDVWRGTPEPYLQSARDFAPHDVPAALLLNRMSEADWTRFCSNALPSFARPSAAQVRELAARRQKSARTAKLFGPEDWPEFYRWTRRFSPAEMLSALSVRPELQGVAEISELKVLERAPSGHIKQLQIVGAGSAGAEAATLTLLGDAQIRSMLSGRLGSTGALPSSTFVILPQRDAIGRVTQWVFKGAGWGHGVGMCQRGAQNRAQAGWTARQIVSFYFHDVQVRDINPQP